MHIRRIDICGFKSFNDKTVISFDDGITGIVGPNGCGKSNVVDALRWVMGEQSARQLRGSAMADLLFNGSERAGPAGMAEVSLTLTNERSSQLPAPYANLSEINIKRRLYRSGESEYRINNESCRLMDITGLLLGTGAGRRAYSIIEQGKVGLIINARPEERRSLLEEAAGISKYRWRKQMAERKLTSAEQNLLRVSDIVAELRRQLGSLERQARKAARYRKLKQALRELELQAAAMQWLDFQARLAHLRRCVEEGIRIVEACQKVLETLHAERLHGRQAVEQADGEAAACLRRQHELEKELQRVEQLREFRSREAADLGAREESLSASAQSCEERLAVLVAEGRDLADQLATTKASLEDADRARAIAESSVVAAVAAETEARQELATQRHEAVEASARISSRTREADDVERQLTELRERQDRLDAEASQLDARRSDFRSKLAELTGVTDATRQLKMRLETEQGELELLLDRARSALAAEEAQHSSLGQSLAARRSRLQSLVELRRAYEGYQEGVRTLLRAGAEGISSGVRFVVADAFHAPAEIETALEVYLGQFLQEAVVEDSRAGLAALGYLREREGGRGTLIPLDILPQSVMSAPERTPGVLGRALDLVRVTPGFEHVAEALLGRAWIVADLDTALRLRETGTQADLLTLGGEILFGNGMLTGGRSPEMLSGALHQRREIEELADEVTALEAQLASSARGVAGLRERIVQGEDSLKALARGNLEKEVSLAHHQQDVRRVTEQLHACEERLAQVAAEREEDQTSVSHLVRTKDEIAGDLEGLASRLATAREAIGTIERSLPIDAEAAQSAQRRITEVQVDLAAVRERRAAAVARNEKLAEGMRLVEGERASAVEQLEVTRRRAGAIVEEQGKLVEASGRLGQEVEAARRTHLDLATNRDQRASDLATLEQRDEVERARADLEKEKHTAAAMGLRECELEVGHLEAVTRDLLGAELALEVHRFHHRPALSVEEAQRLGELRLQVADMGEINLSAIEEHRELEERHENLTRQQTDLQDGIAQLREAIGRIGRQSERRFAETFELVNRRFGEVFPRMFGGGQANLTLTEADGDGHEGGVEILAQPPGKKLQSIDLMSGGEKALTAVALVFAIFLVKPTPFCVLDEVDAPLDEVNVGRYLAALREMSTLSQFIVITHNKRTMEAADTLYGVTMEEPGCSKLVSVKLNRPVASAA
jgi:chromosome segregation protein